MMQVHESPSGLETTINRINIAFAQDNGEDGTKIMFGNGHVMEVEETYEVVDKWMHNR